MKDIVIPQALQIVVDDLGWFCGDDDRVNGGASRSGMPRRHCYKDYEAMHELGKALDQKIFCAFCLSEWDPDNRLKKFPTISKYGENWDNARFYDADEVKKCVDVINSSEYIDFALHGIGHGYYCEENLNKDSSDYYIIKRTENGKERVTTGETYVRGILDSFFELMEYHGIKKEVNSFVPPSGSYLYNDLSKILADYGIKYVSAPFRFIKNFEGERPEDIFFENGIITTERYNDLIPWDGHSVDYRTLPVRYNTFGSHWPNWLHEDPDRNMEVIKSAIKYFYRCAEDPETVISRDIKFASTQTMFWKFAEISENEKGETVIDISNVPKHENANKVFYVNSRFPITCIGGKMTEYAGKKNFITYEIEPESDKIILF